MLETAAPVCFGAVSYYSGDSDKCLACASFDSCSVQVQANIAELGRVIDIEGLMERHRAVMKNRAKKPVAEPDRNRLVTQAPLVERNMVPAKATLREAGVDVQALATSILLPIAMKGGIEQVRSELKSGRNPFPQSMSEQWVVCELLRHGAATRASIEKAVEKISGDVQRSRAYVSTLAAAKMVTVAGEAVQL